MLNDLSSNWGTDESPSKKCVSSTHSKRGNLPTPGSGIVDLLLPKKLLCPKRTPSDSSTSWPRLPFRSPILPERKPSEFQILPLKSFWRESSASCPSSFCPRNPFSKKWRTFWRTLEMCRWNRRSLWIHLTPARNSGNLRATRRSSSGWRLITSTDSTTFEDRKKSFRKRSPSWTTSSDSVETPVLWKSFRSPFKGIYVLFFGVSVPVHCLHEFPPSRFLQDLCWTRLKLRSRLALRGGGLERKDSQVETLSKLQLYFLSISI